MINSYLSLDITGAKAAFSLRNLGSYTGNVIRVRRSSDNTEQDFSAFGIVNGELTTFCGAGNGFIVTWYDQTPNGNNVTQSTTTKQPLIVSSGALATLNGLPCIQFDGIDDQLSCPVFSTALSNFWIFSALQRDTNTKGVWYKNGDYNGYGAGFGLNTLDVNGDEYILLREAISWDDTNYSTNSTIHQIITNTRTGAGLLEFYQNGTNIFSGAIGDSSTPNGTFSIGGYTLFTTDRYLDCKMQEFIFFESDQSTTRPKIEANLKRYYNIA